MGTPVKKEVKKPSKLSSKKVTKNSVTSSPNSTSSDKNFEDIMEKIGRPEYSGRVYEKDTVVPVAAPLFVDFLNLNHESTVNLQTMRQGLTATKSNIENLIGVIDQMLLGQDIMTAKFAEKHIENVDAGLTREMREEDVQAETSN